MRVLLAALNAPKGEVAGNLERHVAVPERARAEGCRLAVFGIAERAGPAFHITQADAHGGRVTVEVPMDAAASGRVAPRR
jgi:predicted amidohydrolase